MWLLYRFSQLQCVFIIEYSNCMNIYHSNSFGSVLYRLLCYFCISQYAKEIAEMFLWAPF